jgi:hypothetical protein
MTEATPPLMPTGVEHTDYEAFLREAAAARGISPDLAVRVANTEGGLTEAARCGDFSGPPWYSGKSWWMLQLHYGGHDTPYAAWGGSAGQGNSFTQLTGWQPGDPAAWRDACRYALNRARTGGWGPWYGAASIGVTGWMGIDRQQPWNPDAERWDFETGVSAPIPQVVYRPSEPPHPQDKNWDCSQESAEWALWSVGRRPADAWMEQSMIDAGVISPDLGLLDSTGAGLAGWLNRHYGEDGYSAYNAPSVTFEALAEAAGVYPIMAGGRAWNHWSGLRAYDAEHELLLLANPSAGWRGVNQTLDREQFDRLGPFSAVHLTHDDLLDPIGDPTPTPPPTPVPPPSDALVRQIEQQQAYIAELETKLGVASVDYARDLDGLAQGVANVAAALRALHPPP